MSMYKSWCMFAYILFYIMWRRVKKYFFMGLLLLLLFFNLCSKDIYLTYHIRVRIFEFKSPLKHYFFTFSTLGKILCKQKCPCRDMYIIILIN